MVAADEATFQAFVLNRRHEMAKTLCAAFVHMASNMHCLVFIDFLWY